MTTNKAEQKMTTETIGTWTGKAFDGHEIKITAMRAGDEMVVVAQYEFGMQLARVVETNAEWLARFDNLRHAGYTRQA